MMCKLKGGIDKEGSYEVEMKGWMQNWGIKMFKCCI